MVETCERCEGFKGRWVEVHGERKFYACPVCDGSGEIDPDAERRLDEYREYAATQPRLMEEVG